MLDSSVRRLFNDIQPMKNFPRTGKKVRPKTAAKGKHYLCASAANEARSPEDPAPGTARSASARKSPRPSRVPRPSRSRKASSKRKLALWASVPPVSDAGYNPRQVSGRRADRPQTNAASMAANRRSLSRESVPASGR